MTKSSNALGSGCLMIFAIPFAAVGISMSIWLFSTLSRCHRSLAWTEVPARILDAKLDVSRGKKGGSTYRCDARYTYEINGQTHESTRVSFFGGSDNIGSFQKDKYNELRAYVAPATPNTTAIERDPRTDATKLFRCYVNPSNPTDAVLYREIRLPMIAFMSVFALVFGGVGFGLIGGGIASLRGQRTQKILQQQHPAEPWKWNPNWATGTIPADRSAAIFLTLFAIFWNAIAFPAGWFAVQQGIKTGQHAAYFVLLFPLIGLALAAGAVHQIASARKFGKTVLVLGANPGVLGGKLAGLIRLPIKIRPNDGFHLELKCTRSITTGSGKRRRTENITLHTATQHIKADASRSLAETTIPLLFPIPYDLPPSDPAAAQPINWTLHVTADNPGIDLNVKFQLPIFQTPESNPAYVHDDSPIRPFLAA